MNITEKLFKQKSVQIEICPEHGKFESHNYIGHIWSKCPSCTKIEQDKRDQEIKHRNNLYRLRQWETKIGDAAIPERFRDRTLESYNATTAGQEHALKFAEAYAENFASILKTGKSAIFLGKPGTGKTHLASGIALSIMSRQGRTVLFTTVMRGIRRVKDSWSRNSSENEGQAVGAMASPDLLILDEVGIQFGSDFERNILFDVINERYEKRKPTILISNLSKDYLVQYLGGRIFDRLREDGGELITFDWESYRGKLKN